MRTCMTNSIQTKVQKLYKQAMRRERERRTLDLTDIAFVKDRDGTILTDGESIRKRWEEVFQLMLNVENVREEIKEAHRTDVWRRV